MLKIERSDVDIERIAECLLNHMENRSDITDSFVAEIRDLPDRWLKAIWPNATDKDILEEFRYEFDVMELYEFEPIGSEDDPYFVHAENLRNSWLTKRVEIMLLEGNLSEDEEDEVIHMLDVIKSRKRRCCRYIREIIEDVD